jgi:glycosyltransferase involved in cell wall biosynthesis
VRALVVSNMLPDGAHPERGRFVRDQVAALQRIAVGDAEIELLEFSPGPRSLAGAVPELRRRGRALRPDVVHAHFGLTAWPALAAPARVRALTLHGTDVRHPRTRLLTYAAIPTIDVLGTASAALAAELPRPLRSRAVVLPCGVDVERFAPVPRAHARAQLELDPGVPLLLFPADPARPEKRHDRALALARAAGAELAVLGGIDPDAVPLWVNAANAVVIPSEREGFGLAALEALACDVPVLATPVGIHAEALAGIEGALCSEYDPAAWLAALRPHLADQDARIAGRARAERFSAERMAERVLAAWGAAVQRTS